MDGFEPYFGDISIFKPPPIWDPIPFWLFRDFLQRISEPQQKELAKLQIRLEVERAKIFREASERIAKLDQEKFKSVQEIIG